MLQIDNLVFSYHKKKNPIFDGINLSIQPGAVYGLLGKNGIGKSTLLYMMSGLMFPHKGSIRLDGVEVKRRLPETLEKIFLVPEEFDLPAISVDAYVRRNSVFYPHFNCDQFNRYLTDFELEGTSNLAKTSMGQKKKYLVSFALATNTPLLLMDEPTNGMDIPVEKPIPQGYRLGHERAEKYRHLDTSSARPRKHNRPYRYSRRRPAVARRRHRHDHLAPAVCQRCWRSRYRRGAL